MGFNPIGTVKGVLTGMKAINSVQVWLSGKKTYLGAVAIAVPALVEIINMFADHGLRGIGQIPKSDSYVQLVAAILAMTTRAAIAKAGDPSKDPKPN